MNIMGGILHKKDIDHIKERYQNRIGEHGLTFNSLNSGSFEKQEIRCKIHSSVIIKDNSSILDIGCGLGYFYEYLHKNEFKFNYTGYDIIPEYVEECKKRFPTSHFECRNILEEGIDGEYDTIVASQVFNNHYNFSDNLTVMKEALSLAYKHTIVSLSIDMLSVYVDYQNPDVYYYSPEEIFKFAKSIAKRVALRHDYRSFEFSIQIFHDEFGDFVL